MKPWTLGTLSACALGLFSGYANATTLLFTYNAPAFDYTSYSFDIAATASSETLSFAYANKNAYFDLTGISVAPATGGSNLIQNGAFQTGTFAGYTQSGNVGSSVVLSGVSGAYVPSQLNYARLGGNGTTDGVLSQAVGTTVGTVYDVSFFLKNETAGSGGVSNDFTASFGPTPVSSVPIPASLPLFGAALTVLAGVGYGINRRNVDPSRTTSACTA